MTTQRGFELPLAWAEEAAGRYSKYSDMAKYIVEKYKPPVSEMTIRMKLTSLAKAGKIEHTFKNKQTSYKFQRFSEKGQSFWILFVDGKRQSIEILQLNPKKYEVYNIDTQEIFSYHDSCVKAQKWAFENIDKLLPVS